MKITVEAQAFKGTFNKECDIQKTIKTIENISGLTVESNTPCNIAISEKEFLFFIVGNIGNRLESINRAAKDNSIRNFTTVTDPEAGSFLENQDIYG